MIFCTNCGVELPLGARFCPRCASPAPIVPDELEPEEPPPRARRLIERVLFAVLLLLLAALVVFAVLVIGFGFFVEG